MIRHKAYPDWVDGEVGRFEFTTHQVYEGDDLVYDTASDVFPQRGRWEWYLTSGFQELAFIYGVTEDSYRKTSRRLNRLRHQADRDGTPARSLQAQAEREGTRLQHALVQKATHILNAAHVSEQDGVVLIPALSLSSQACSMPQNRVDTAIETCQKSLKGSDDIRGNSLPYEAPELTVNISVADVGVKRQKAERSSSAATPNDQASSETSTQGRKPRKYAHTTVVHIEQQQRTYVLAGHGIAHVFRLVLAFLLSNDLGASHLQFFTDGYGILHDAIRQSFSWCPNLVIVLDWYHLLKKCQLQLSLACVGRDARNTVLKELLPLLWHGLVDQAIAYIQALDGQHIKNPDALTKLVGYLERNRAHIPCYAVRKALGLRNSSQIGEKMNDLLVSDRQKHRGMSWSKTGSVSLAVLAALKRNGEHAQWFDEGDIDFKLAA
jgi:hypothetical protein